MELKLYKTDFCPFCQRVLREIQEEGRTDIELCDINHEKRHKNDLVKLGGKKQVPCLFIDDKPLYESRDIIAWLKEHPQQQ